VKGVGRKKCGCKVKIPRIIFSRAPPMNRGVAHWRPQAWARGWGTCPKCPLEMQNMVFTTQSAVLAMIDSVRRSPRNSKWNIGSEGAELERRTVAKIGSF